MSLLYRSERIGRFGRPFQLLKVRTLKPGDGSFAHQREYVWGGRFMRKFRVDELPQLFNILRGDMSLFGPRPREAREIDFYPDHTRTKLLSVKPGLFCLAGVAFMDEEHMLKASLEPNRDYFEKILPIKLALDFFWIDNRSILLNLAIIWMAIKARLTNHND